MFKCRGKGRRGAQEERNEERQEERGLLSLCVSGSSLVSRSLLCLIGFLDVFLITSLVGLVHWEEAEGHGKSHVEGAQLLPFFALVRNGSHNIFND